jgi:hypothetical protein
VSKHLDAGVQALDINVDAPGRQRPTLSMPASSVSTTASNALNTGIRAFDVCVQVL